MRNYEDHLFLSARLGALEKRLISKKDISAMAAAKDADELFRKLGERGIALENDPENGADHIEALLRRLSDAYLAVLSDAPDKGLFAPFTYPYDCHNLKTALKYAIKGESGRKFMIPLGTVSPEKAESGVIRNELSAFPANMASAVDIARREYAKRRDPQIIDLTLDHACFEDMKSELDARDARFMRNVLKVKADTTNISTAVRLARAGYGNGKLPPENAFVSGGGIPIDIFLGLFKKGDVTAALSERLSRTEYSTIGGILRAEKTDMEELERVCDGIRISHVMRSKDAVSGCEAAARYLTMAEYEVKDLRILITGKIIGEPCERIVARLRETGV